MPLFQISSLNLILDYKFLKIVFDATGGFVTFSHLSVIPRSQTVAGLPV